MNIEIRGLSKHFNGQVIFEDFSTDIYKQKITALMGESGLGKTTLLRLIAGLDTAYTGKIRNVPERKSFLFQDNLLLPWKNVVENIAFPVQDILPEAEVQEAIGALLSLTYLTGHEQKYPHELSGGMQRRVALCRALIYPADLLLLDEPFSGLDGGMSSKISESVFSRLGAEKTVVMVTHNEAVIERCDEKINFNQIAQNRSAR